MHSFGMQAPKQAFKKKPPTVKKTFPSQSPITYQETIPVDEAPLEIKPSPPATYQELIAALQNNQTVTITDFLHCIDDAKKHNLQLYFISQKLINSSNLKDQILILFQKSISDPDAFKNETNNILFRAHKIEAGFICVVNKELYESRSSIILTIQPKRPNPDEKLKILATFNIKKSTSNKEKQQIDNPDILSFPLASNSELETFYDEVTKEIKKLKEIAQEKETPSEPEKEIVPEPGVEIVEPEKKEEQSALAEKYSPLTQQIQSMGAIPGELKNKATQLIENLKKGSLEPSEIDNAQKFFTDLATKIKKTKEEAAVPTTQEIKEPPKKISYMDLITRLQNNETITISDFLQYLDNAKKEKQAFYFISTDFINSRSEKLKDNIVALFEIGISNPDIFKDEIGNILFKVYTIQGGFICLVSTDLYGNLYTSSVVLINNPTQPDLDTKLMILNTFNIKKSDTDTKINNINNNKILSFPLEANMEIEGLYDAVIDEIKGVKELIEEKLATKKASLEPEKKVEIKSAKSPTPIMEGIDIYTIPLGLQ